MQVNQAPKWSTSATTNYQDSLAFENLNKWIPVNAYDSLFDTWSRAEGNDKFVKFIQKDLHTDLMAVKADRIMTVDEKFTDCTRFRDRIHRIVWETISNREMLDKTGDSKYLGWSLKAKTDLISYVQVSEAGKEGVVRIYKLKHLQKVLTPEVLAHFNPKNTSTDKRYSSELYSIDTRILESMGVNLEPVYDEWWENHHLWGIATQEQEKRELFERKERMKKLN